MRMYSMGKTIYAEIGINIVFVGCQFMAGIYIGSLYASCEVYFVYMLSRNSYMLTLTQKYVIFTALLT
jgi:hypothetical protein